MVIKMTVDEIKKSKLFKQIHVALISECYYFIGEDLSKLDEWELQTLTSPSDLMQHLQNQIPEEQSDIWFETIEQEVQLIVHSLKQSEKEVDFL